MLHTAVTHHLSSHSCYTQLSPITYRHINVTHSCHPSLIATFMLHTAVTHHLSPHSCYTQLSPITYRHIHVTHICHPSLIATFMLHTAVTHHLSPHSCYTQLSPITYRHIPIRIFFFCELWKTLLKDYIHHVLNREKKYAHSVCLDTTYNYVRTHANCYSEGHLIKFYSKFEVRGRRKYWEWSFGLWNLRHDTHIPVSGYQHFKETCFL